jgi:hypothetical protein
MALLALVFVAALCSAASLDSFLASSPSAYERGLSIGANKKRMIQGFLQEYFFRSYVVPWCSSNPTFHTTLLSSSLAAYPAVGELIRGIATAAEANITEVQMFSMRPEITTAIMASADKSASVAAKAYGARMGCSDVLVNTKAAKFIAHNEDWPPETHPYMFLLTEITGYKPETKEVTQHHSLVYPGYIPGSSFSWTSTGLVFTTNWLSPVPPVVDPGRVARYWVSCDLLQSTGIEDAVKRLTRVKHALGFSVNIADMVTGKMANIEISPINVDVHWVTNNSTYWHVNSYRRIHITELESESSEHRSARIKAMAEPRTVEDALAILGDTADLEFPIYRNANPPDERVSTLSSIVFDLNELALTVYTQNPVGGPLPTAFVSINPFR